jgi:hypothetical protein
VFIIIGGMLTWGRGGGWGGRVVHWGFSFPFINIETFESNNNTQLTTWGGPKKKKKKNESHFIEQTNAHVENPSSCSFYPIQSPEPNELYHKKTGKKKNKVF